MMQVQYALLQHQVSTLHHLKGFSLRQIVQYQTHSVYYAHHGNASDLHAFPELSSV